MRQSAPYAVIGLGVIVMAGIAWWFGFREKEPEPAPASAQPAIELSEGLSIYTNGEHGFLIAYPEGAEVAEAFDVRRLNPNWRIGAKDAGMPLLQITTYRIEGGNGYPRDYQTLMRIGKSERQEDVRACTSSGNGETAAGSREIAGEEWAAFSYSDAAMMQFVEAKSYRTVHDGACWAIETIRTGSNYREDGNAGDIPEETLGAEYERLTGIVDSFRFAR